MIEETKFLIDLVQEASKLIDNKFEISNKGSNGDLVTDMDFAVERFVMEKIKSTFPQFDVVSEEINSEKQITQNCFVLDPIDGTINFAHGLPLWGIQIACVKNFETVSAVIFLPKLNELYYADNTGAFCNGVKIKVKNHPLSSGVYSLGGKHHMPCSVRMKKVAPNVRCYYCACMEYAWVAKGTLTAFAYLGDNYWDYMPGEFIAKQAGATVLSDKKLHIAAGNPELANLILKNCKHYEKDEAFTNFD